jgi:hypothetical protein
MRITLCGSAKFESAFHEWNKKLTLAGHTVYGLAVYPSSMEGNKDWYNEQEKIILDLIHLDKILNSDIIVVIDVDGYTGFSTKREIQWARIQGKRVFWITKDKNINENFNDYWAGSLL